MKEAFYFSHDANAQHDPKVIKMLYEMGWQGYGLYWAVVEKLRNEANYKLPLDYKCLAYALRTDKDILKNLINKYGLFSIDDTDFYSESLMERMKIKDTKSMKARESANARWNKSQCDRITIKEKKVNKVKEINIPFQEFWNLYSKKVGDRSKCERKWISLLNNERILIMKTLPKWIKQFTDRKFQPHPMTYLNQNRWLDEWTDKQENKPELFRKDTNDMFYIGYCEKCNKSDFYKTVNEDSRCCKSKLFPNKR